MRTQELHSSERIVRSRLEALHEANPMMGLRGCRLGIVHPEISEMQVGCVGLGQRPHQRLLLPATGQQGRPACRGRLISLSPSFLLLLPSLPPPLTTLAHLATAQQAYAIFEAATNVVKSGGTVHPHIMVPLVRAL